MPSAHSFHALTKTSDSSQPGITTHAECTRAWPEKGGTHLDPGPFFPIREYVDFVSEAGEAKGVT